MSPISQYTAVATVTFAVLGFQTVAFVGLALTLILLLAGYVSLGRLLPARQSREWVEPEESAPGVGDVR